jgi:hypothetical protein
MEANVPIVEDEEPLIILLRYNSPRHLEQRYQRSRGAMKTSRTNPVAARSFFGACVASGVGVS